MSREPEPRTQVLPASTAAPPTGDELPPGFSLGEYVIERKIGEGGMGVVYAGNQPHIGKKVAIKVLAAACARLPEMTGRFVAEARAVNRIRHPNIVDIFAFGQVNDGRPYFVMEYLEGSTLGGRLERGSIPTAELSPLLQQICSALEAAHQAGVVHRDLKPENIWIAEPKLAPPYAKLLDFGIAKLLGSALPSQTAAGMFIGTPTFMAPEQCLGRPVDARADIYALGVILYLIFTRTLPFSGTSFAELATQHIGETPPPPSTRAALPPDVDAIILECLRKDPAERPASAQAVGDRLVRALAEPAFPRTIALPREPPPRTIALPPARAATPRRPPDAAHVRRLPYGWFAAAGVAVLALALFALAGPRAPRRAPVAKEPVPAAPPVAVQAPPPAPAPPPAAQLRIEVQNARASRVLLDGRELARETQAIGPLPIAPDVDHDLLVEAPGMLSIHQSIRAAAGATLDLPLAMTRVRPSRPRPPAAGEGVADRHASGSDFGTVGDPPAVPTPSASEKRGLIRENPIR